MPLKEPQASVAAAEAVDGVVSHPGHSHGPGTGVRQCESTHMARKKKQLAGGVKGCCGQSSRSSADLKAAVHVATAPASHRNERHATKKQRPWRPAKHARHSLGAFCSMRSVLGVLFYSFLPKRGQQGD